MKTDVAIIGGGPGGSSMAMFLKRQGISSVIIEKEEFPRYHIGESMTGECGGIIRNLGLAAKMDNPDNVCIKHGLTVYGSNAKNKWYAPVMARDENWNLVPQTTWQIRRSWFDQMMLDEAVERGATLIPGTATRPLCHDDGSVRGVQVRTAEGGLMDIETEMLVDASGQHTFLGNAGVTSRKYRGNYDKQMAIFSQVDGAIRDEGPHSGDTLIFYKEKYHWAWFIPLDQTRTSVGIVSPAAYFLGKKESKRDFFVREMMELNPELAQRTQGMPITEEVRAIPNYSYQIKQFTGKGWMCLGDAHRFVDPIFSFGLIVAMKEAELGAKAIKDYLEGKDRDKPNPLAEYQRFVDNGMDVFEDMIDLFWEYPIVFALFINHRYPGEMIDCLAGRMFWHQEGPVVDTCRQLLHRTRVNDVNAAPIGSRYQDDPIRNRRNLDALGLDRIVFPN
ncbi:MAG: NAD(P)/FAD-dependent oxidoreductase [Chloroflexota bacterium]